MKIACLVFLICRLALAQGASYGAQPKVASQRQSSGSAADVAETPKQNHRLKRASLRRASRPMLLPNNNRERSTFGARNLPQPGSVRSDAMVKKRLIQREEVNHAILDPSRSVIPSTGPPFSNVRHRSPNPAIISGVVTSKTGNTEAINGSRIGRRH